MENASKALLIAGGILIALVLIVLFINMYGRISNIRNEQEKQQEAEQLAAFNAGFEAYNKRVMYGADVITLINKAKESKQYTITVNAPAEFNKLSSLTDEQKKELTTILYKCTEMKYDSKTGRINYIKIEKY